MRKYILLLPFFLSVFVSSGQKLPGTLLWKISGNGLQKPSYLFGTMHLTDERLFQLGDSLYKAIEYSEGFAIEVNPDDMTTYLIDGVKKEIRNSRRLMEMLDEKKYKKYSAALSKKLNKPADEITTRDIFTEKNKWVSESYRTGKMSTFLDAYLYDIARRQGKWTGGVEDMDDQKNLIDNLVDESDIEQIVADAEGGSNPKRAMEQFIKVYISEDINIIDSMMNYADSAYIDALLVKRNIKMARRMDSLSNIRSMVFAVGAAHLPGNSGLISLLRSKGFSVQPVFSSKKVKPEAYKVKEVEIPWITVEDDNRFYSVQMPGKPGDIRMFGLLEMKMHFDIFNSTGYLVTGVSTPYDKHGIDSVIAGAITSMFDSKTLKKAKPIIVNGISGKEVEKIDEEGYKKGYFLNKGNVVYMAVGFATKKDNKSSIALNKFFSSFKVLEKDINATTRFYTYTDTAYAFQLDVPSKPQSGNDLTEGSESKSMRSHLNICSDLQTGAYFLFGVNEVAPGYHIENDSTTIQNIRSNVAEKYAVITTDTSYVKRNHRILELNGIMSNASLNMKSYYEFRGNRWYALVAIYDSSRAYESVRHFFKSFQLLEYPASAWKKYTSDDGIISTWSPAPLQYKGIDSTDNDFSAASYQVFDSTRSESYMIMPEKFGKYYWRENDSIFWEDMIERVQRYDDTLLSKKNIRTGDIRGVELILQKKGSLNLAKRIMFLFGDSLYTIHSVFSAESLNNDNTSRFFSEFRFNKKASPATIFNSKASKLISDLSAADSTTRAEAAAAISSAPFSKRDLPLLHKAVFENYKDSVGYETVNDKLATHIMEIGDTASLSFALGKYKSVSDPDHKNILLAIISGYKTKANYETLKNLLLQSPLSKEPSYEFRNNFSDSMLLVSGIVQDLFPLLKDTSFASILIDVSSTLIDSSVISIQTLQPYQQQILKFAEWRFKKNRDGDDFDYTDYSLIKTLGLFNNGSCNAMLQQWLTLGDDDDYLRMEAIEALLKNSQPITGKVLQKLAAKNSQRVELYELLKKYKKETLFPSQYLNQKSFAESMIYVSASDDYEPTEMTYLTQKVITFQGKKAKFYFYKITYGEDDYKTYNLGCAGPFETGASKISDRAEGAVYFEEEFDSSNLQEQIKALIKEMEEWYKPDDKK